MIIFASWGTYKRIVDLSILGLTRSRQAIIGCWIMVMCVCVRLDISDSNNFIFHGYLISPKATSHSGHQKQPIYAPFKTFMYNFSADTNFLHMCHGQNLAELLILGDCDPSIFTDSFILHWGIIRYVWILIAWDGWPYSRILVCFHHSIYSYIKLLLSGNII